METKVSVEIAEKKEVINVESVTEKQNLSEKIVSGGNKNGSDDGSFDNKVMINLQLVTLMTSLAALIIAAMQAIIGVFGFFKDQKCVAMTLFFIIVFVFLVDSFFVYRLSREIEKKCKL